MFLFYFIKKLSQKYHEIFIIFVTYKIINNVYFLYFSGTKLIYDYESHIQSKILSISKNEQNQHLSFKVQAKLEVMEIWKSLKNESILSIQVSYSYNCICYRHAFPKPDSLH